MNIPIITTEELKTLIDNNQKFTLIDVREKSELVHGMIPTAKNIPLREIEQAFNFTTSEFKEKYEFSKPKENKSIIFYCRTGGRSERATVFAIKKGYKNIKNYKGSAFAWSEIDQNVKKY